MGDDANRPDGAKSRARRASHVVSVNDDTSQRPIAPNHLDDLRRSGLTDETIALAGLYSEGQSKPIAEILGWSWRNGGALVFPFRDYDSRKVLLSRVKPDKPRIRPGKNKPIKYEQPPGTGAIPYFGPRCIAEQRLDKKSLLIYWTEGEKKTLLLDQMGLAAIGLTGCHNFNDSQAYRNGDGLTWAKPLRKYAERFVKGRKHVIVYDSDAFENENVMLAMQRLAGLLLHDGAESVRYVRIPPDPNDADRGVGIDDFFVENGEEATRNLFKNAKPIAVGEEIAPIPPKDPLAKLSALQWLRSAKIPGDLRLPPRFEVRRDKSLWFEPSSDKDGEIKEVMRSVIVPTALLQSMDEEDGEQRIEITYYARDEWRRAIVDRRSLRDARRALAELPADCAISSNNAATVVAWFDEYFRHNEHRLELRRFVSECGWHKTAEGESVFLLDKPIASDEARGKVRIEADDSGDRSEILRSLRPKGSLEAHTAALNRAFAEDKVAAVMILGALAAPLLKPLHAPNFAIHLSGDSSKGKTSKLVCGASVYGDPNNEQWLGSWNTSPTAIELRAQTLCDLPLCFDEVGAGDRYLIDRWIYMLINGSGKARAERSLKLRKTPSWRTIVLSTGEHELASEKASTGAQVRVIQFRVSGFGSLDAKGVDDIREACERNCGQVGRKWIHTLCNIEDWSPYVELFSKAKDQFRSKKDGSRLAQRQAVYFALLALTEHIASQSIGIGKKGGQTVRELFLDGTERREIKTVGARAIEIASEAIASEPDSFPPLEYNTSGGLISRPKAYVKRINGVRYRSHVYWLPERLRELLEASGLSYNEVVSSWRDAGHTDCDPGRTVKRVRWDGKRLFVVAVKYEALGIDTEAVQTSIGEKSNDDDEGGDFADV